MTTSGPGTTVRAALDNLCAVAAAERAEDPIGSGLFTARALAIEVPPPWGDSFYRSDPEGTLQQRASAIMTAYYERLFGDDSPVKDPFAEGYVGVFAIAPDSAWSDPAITRALLITRPAGPFRAFDIAEYHFPRDSERVLDLIRALIDEVPDYSAIEEFRVPHGAQRELFVCTHGQVDICCGKFGFPLYAEAHVQAKQEWAAQQTGTRVWRTSHFGGHRYAPTAWEMPSGYMWGFLEEASTRSVMSRDGDSAALLGKVRGSGGLRTPLQILDRVGFEEFGWAWLDFERSGTAEQAAPDEKRWHARLEYRAPDGSTGAYEGDVGSWRELPAGSCGTDVTDTTYTVPEYHLTSLTRSSG